jgi:Ca-activated chloride channel family protein
MQEEGNIGVAPSGGNNNNTNNINVTVVPSVQHALRGVVNVVDFLFTIKTPKKEETKKRAPCDISFVLDRSGSMAGEKLANCKRTVAQMVESLTEQDRVHLVAYDDDAEIIFEEGNPVENRQELLAKIESVHDKGCTNLHEGVERGGQLITKYMKDERQSFKSVFVFSDGLANRGKSGKSDIFQLVDTIRSQGITVSSYGIGADFDEDMMKGIQQHGTGDYFFIENEGEINRLVSLGFQGLLASLGSNAVFKIRGKNGGVLKKIFSHPDPIKGVAMGNLISDNTTQILARLDITPDGRSNAEVLTWELSYLPEGSKETESVTGTFSIDFTDDEKLVAAQESDQQVKVMLVIQEVIEGYTDVLKMIDSGNIKGAIAMQESSVQKLREILSLDASGIVARMLASKEKGLVDLKTKSSAVARKKMHKEAYEDCRMDSYGYMEH